MTWAFLLLALGGVLIGGAYSLWKQKAPRWVPISFVVLAAMSLVGAGLFAFG